MLLFVSLRAWQSRQAAMRARELESPPQPPPGSVSPESEVSGSSTEKKKVKGWTHHITSAAVPGTR
jgi:hypothetical protein